MKYNINPIRGEIGECSAAPGNCPYAEAQDHYGSPGEARAAYELKAVDLEAGRHPVSQSAIMK